MARHPAMSAIPVTFASESLIRVDFVVLALSVDHVYGSCVHMEHVLNKELGYHMILPIVSKVLTVHMETPTSSVSCTTVTVKRAQVRHVADVMSVCLRQHSGQHRKCVCPSVG